MTRCDVSCVDDGYYDLDVGVACCVVNLNLDRDSQQSV